MQPHDTTRPHKSAFSEEEEKEICHRYQTPDENGKYPSARDLDAKWGLPRGTVWSIIKRNGIKPHRNLSPQNRRAFNEQTELEICARYQTPDENGDLPTVKGLAKEYGCSVAVMRRLLLYHGVELRPNQAGYSRRIFDKETETAICEYYWTKLPSGYYPSMKEICAKFKCSVAPIRDALRRNGYRFRTAAESRGGRSNKPVNLPPGPAPLCACGCGTPVEWIAKQSLWLKYAKGHYRPKKKYHSREWLCEEYVKKGRSTEDIAFECSVTPTTVYKFVVKYGFERKRIAELGIERVVKSKARRRYNRYVKGWQKISKAIRERDSWTCQLCGESFETKPKELHVHHIDDNKKNNHSHNLISLCKYCHGPVHGKEEKRAMLVEIAIRNTDSESVALLPTHLRQPVQLHLLPLAA